MVFLDLQLRGLSAEWVHRHSFNAVDDQTTEVVDVITLRPRSLPCWWLVGIGMRAGLPFLFAFRVSKTRKMLE